VKNTQYGPRLLVVSFDGLTLLIGDRKGIQPIKKTCATYPQRFSSRTNGGTELKGTRKPKFSLQLTFEIQK